MRHSTRLPTRRRSRWGGVLLGVVAAVLVVGGSLGVASVLLAPAASSAHAVRDMRGNLVRLDPGVPVGGAPDAESDIGQKLSVPSVGLEVPLGAVDAVDGVITPPGFTSAYLVRNLGVGLSDASTGTVYVVMHSIRGGGVAPGNYLFDLKTQKSKLSVGAKVRVGKLTYDVTGTSMIGKALLSSASTVWEDVPRRLVLVTCLQRPDGTASIDNLVISAALEG